MHHPGDESETKDEAEKTHHPLYALPGWPISDPPLYFDRQGEPIDVYQWAEYSKDQDYRIISRDIVTAKDGSQFLVSTVWVGINMNILDREFPVIFETMVFNKDGNSVGMNRYAIEEAARKDHEEICEYIRITEDIRPLRYIES